MYNTKTSYTVIGWFLHLTHHSLTLIFLLLQGSGSKGFHCPLAFTNFFFLLLLLFFAFHVNYINSELFEKVERGREREDSLVGLRNICCKKTPVNGALFFFCKNRCNSIYGRNEELLGIFVLTTKYFPNFLSELLSFSLF